MVYLYKLNNLSWLNQSQSVILHYNTHGKKTHTYLG